MTAISRATIPSALTQLPNERPRYSSAELQEYFARIKLPQQYSESPVLSDPATTTTKQHGLPFLQALTRYHVCHVPFENLALHYSAHKTITLDPSDLYAHFVYRRRGGRCMENNSFFGTVLRSLGYEVRNCGGRVARTMSPFPDVRRDQSATYDGWNHMLNLVQFDGEWWVVDVGMGAMGPNLPYPLQQGFETTSIVPRKIRLQLRAIQESYASPSAAPKLWCYDVCYNPISDGGEGENAWVPTYCFTETEFLPQDYEMMSWYTSTHDKSFFTKYVTATRMLMDEAGEKIVGNQTLFKDTIREMVGGKREVLKECKTEEERVRALDDFFGIRLTDEEKEGLPEDLRLG